MRVSTLSRDGLFTLAIMAAAITVVSLLQLWSYLIFHSIVESASAAVAAAIFLIGWNTRRFTASGFYQVLAIALLFCGALDLLHMLAYKGMGVFTDGNENLATQLWVAARYLQAVSFVHAALFVGRQIRGYRTFLAYTAAFALLLLSIFYWRNFPVCFDGDGLTMFKKTSEYVIIGLFALSLLLLIRNRDAFASNIFVWTSLAIVMSIAAEFCFTRYADVYGPANSLGHMFKLVSFMMLYKALVECSLREPYNLIFRELSESRVGLQQARDELELQVRQRTGELQRRAGQLQAMSLELTRAEQRERKRLAEVLHDHLQQLLVAANYHLATLRQQVDDRSHKDSIAYAAHLISDAVQVSRDLSVELSPRVLYESGLCRALEWLADHMKEKYGLKVEVICSSFAKVDGEDLNTLLFYSVRELLFNAVKHAGTTHALVECHVDSEQARIVVSDSGCGFDPAEIGSKTDSVGGFGLFSIKERLDCLAGRMDIESAPGKGCRIAIVVPTAGKTLE